MTDLAYATVFSVGYAHLLPLYIYMYQQLPALLQILNEIAKHKIRIYEFPDMEDDDENNALKKLKVRLKLYEAAFFITYMIS